MSSSSMMRRKYEVTPIGEYRKSQSALPRPIVGTPCQAFNTFEPSQVMRLPRLVNRKFDARGTEPLGWSNTPTLASTPRTNAPELEALRVTRLPVLPSACLQRLWRTSPIQSGNARELCQPRVSDCDAETEH